MKLELSIHLYLGLTLEYICTQGSKELDKCVPELLHPGEDGISDLQGLGHGVCDRLLKQSSGFKEGLLKDHFDLLPVEKESETRTLVLHPSS